MIRMVLAAMLALTLAACNRAAVDAKDPWATMHPWDHGRPGIEKLETGVEYFAVTQGDAKGVSPTLRDRVEVRYDGRIAKTGLIFDSSYQRGETATFPLSILIPGWRDGLQKMKPGDMFMFWIPSAQGYGEQGAGGAIPPNSDLMFQVELVRVLPDPWPAALPWPTDASDIVRLPSGQRSDKSLHVRAPNRVLPAFGLDVDLLEAEFIEGDAAVAGAAYALEVGAAGAVAEAVEDDGFEEGWGDVG